MEVVGNCVKVQLLRKVRMLVTIIFCGKKSPDCFRQVVDRSLESLHEHYREVLLPKIETGTCAIASSIPEPTKFSLPVAYTPKTHRHDPKPHATRVAVCKKEVLIVAQYLAELDELIAPTSKSWWRRITKSYVSIFYSALNKSALLVLQIIKLFLAPSNQGYTSRSAGRYVSESHSTQDRSSQTWG